MKKKCPNCAATNDEAATNCKNCGRALRSAGGGRLCPAGRHTMDPNWTHCPYCEAEAQAPAGPGPAEKEKNTMRSKTVVGDFDERPSRRVTKVEMEAGPPADQRPEGRRETAQNASKIVGVLICYSRDPAGEMFAIREGKNIIGSGDTPDGAPCDILFADDRKMSSSHALILYRRGRYQILDQTSTNGTLVNGDDIDRIDLPNYARIQCGRTEFFFIKAMDDAADKEEPTGRSPGTVEVIEEVVKKRETTLKPEGPLF